MVELTLNLPDEAAKVIQEQVASGRYASAGEFITELIENAQPIIINDRIAELIREGMESGEGVEVTDEYWEGLSERVRKEAERRRSA
jgi:antitoxin ParD1/3/4